ncbi:hypothetical protein LCGC14_1139890 [marine sediment metagenome]|uniref:Uncharacterized protein n=1 Tax=marine sediment metagenome TaxID=412755 RepID=A0A0F9M3D5_9ZZZZ
MNIDWLVNMIAGSQSQRVHRKILDQLIADLNASKAVFDTHTHQIEAILDMGLSKAGLAIHGSAKENVLTANVFEFAIAGICYTLAAQGSIDISALPFTPTELDTAKQRIYLLHVTSGGTIDITEGADHASAAVVPATPAGKAAFGYIKIVNATGSGFTIGTTDMDIGNITETYIDLIGNAGGGQELIASKPGSDAQEVAQGTAVVLTQSLTT